MILKFKNLVDNHFRSEKQVKFYAASLSVSPNQLNQSTQLVAGKSAKALISERVLREAKIQLHYNDEDIAQISYQLGFEEPTHFVRFFRRYEGITPGAYRQLRM
ncbi:MAG: hypothetical protein OHK0053_05110 [Microscillaceae bacterium]